MGHSVWQSCLSHLEGELPADKFNTWVRPLQADEDTASLTLFAPNRFVMDWVKKNYFSRIVDLVTDQSDANLKVNLQVGSRAKPANDVLKPSQPQPSTAHASGPTATPQTSHSPAGQAVSQSQTGFKGFSSVEINSSVNRGLTFDSFVEGKCNMLARAAAVQIVENLGDSHANYNPFLIYGGVGLGKTHLMHAIGNVIIQKNSKARVVYLHSERFVQDMIKALQTKQIDAFKRFYRSVDALLIDDIQFFAGKERSQEEFFHTFNALLEGQKQIIMTCDTYPKEVTGIEERLKSRFGWGLSVAIEPPDVETRVAILMNKAQQSNIALPSDVAFFIAQRVRSNVRELEGALRRVIANARFTGQAITTDFAKQALHDLISLQDKLISIDNIQKTVAEYFKIRVSDLHSKRRTRSVARPRQVAMALSKELTNHSLPEIGDAFGGRDHTTVLHACRKIEELRQQDGRVDEDYANLLRMLTN